MTAISTTRSSRTWLGVVVALAAAAGYAVANTSASVAYQAGSDPMTVAATRFLVPTVALFVWLRFERRAADASAARRDPRRSSRLRHRALHLRPAARRSACFRSRWRC